MVPSDCPEARSCPPTRSPIPRTRPSSRPSPPRVSASSFGSPIVGLPVRYLIREQLPGGSPAAGDDRPWGYAIKDGVGNVWIEPIL